MNVLVYLVPIALALGEIGMSFYVVRISNLLLSDRWSTFAASMVDTTQLRVLIGKLRSQHA